MKQYSIPSEIKSEVKLSKYIFLLDTVIIGIIGIIAWGTKGLVYVPLQIPYLIYSGIIGFFLIIRPSGNPGKRNYQVLLMVLKRDRNHYHSIDIIDMGCLEGEENEI